MNPIHSAKRASGVPRRLLGEARREAAESQYIAASKRRRLAAESQYIAASKRRRLATSKEEHEDEDDDDELHTPAPISSGALGDDDAAVFADALYEDDDKEADEIFEQVDQRMQSRRQKQRAIVLEKQLSKYREVNPTVRQKFADLKSGLTTVSPAEWAAIPDIGDYSVKKQKIERFTPAPDSLLERAQQENASVAVEPSTVGATTDLAAIGAGRTSVLERNLDVASERATSQNKVDHDGYLSAMTGSKIPTNADIGDVKKARQLLKSVTSANPTHSPGWIAAARLEEQVGKHSTARKIILEACRKCMRDEEVWLEAARLHPPEMARRIFAQAVRKAPRSLSIWMRAAALETNSDAKRRVLRKALEIIPGSSELWQAAISLEGPSGARILLSRAVECVPGSLALWLAYAKLETYENAKRILQNAREAIGNEEVRIWITEAQLEEVQQGVYGAGVSAVIEEAVRVLSAGEKAVNREAWLAHAKEINGEQYAGTIGAIVTHTIGMNVDEKKREHTWLAEAKKYEGEKCITLARAVFKHLTRKFPRRVTIWQKYVEFEQRQDDFGQVEDVLNGAVVSCGQEETVWLMLAKHKWKSEGLAPGRQVLQRAFEQLPHAESIWLAAAKIETESGDLQRARELLQRGRMEAQYGKVFMKSALLERMAHERTAERQLLVQGLNKFPKFDKMWLMLAQWFERGEQAQQSNVVNGHAKMSNGDMQLEFDGESEVDKLCNARSAYSMGVEQCKPCAALWIGYCRLEERCGNVAKARAILERGREQCGRSSDLDLLWRENAYLEVRANKVSVAQSVLARGLQECSKRSGRQSGRLWALSVALERGKGQKSRSVDAIKACAEDARVILEVAKFIWRSGKFEKCRSWLIRCVELDRDYGDGWATLLAFEREHGKSDRVRELEVDVERAEPKHGDLWVSVSKKIGHERFTCLEVLRHVERIITKESNVTGFY